MRDKILKQLQESANLKRSLAATQLDTIARMAETLIQCLEAGGRVFTMGNGGSAADAQHIAGELVGRFRRERRGFAAQALSTDTSILTAVANDYGFEDVFRRQVEALVREGDVVIGLSTSGNSPNVLRGCQEAKKRKAKVLGFSGRGGKLRRVAHLCLIVPSKSSPRIQEAHITVAHILCDLVEEALVKRSRRKT